MLERSFAGFDLGLLSGEGWLSPLEAVADEVVDASAVTQTAFEILVNKLATYGNKVGERHANALFSLLHRMAQQCAGEANGRFVFPLPTGMGKTTAILALVVALFRLGYTVSLVIACKTVKTMRELREALLAEGVPDHLVGVKHSDPTVYSTGNDSRRYQFVTHERIRLEGATSLLLEHDGRRRRLCIYDETLVTNRAVTAALRDLDMGIAALAAHPDKDEIQAEVLQRLGAAKLLVDLAVGQLKREAAISCLPVQLPSASEEEITKWQKALLSRSTNLKGYSEALIDFLSMGGGCRIVRTSQGMGLVSISKCFPIELANVMVLDASAPIREIAKLDDSLQIVESWVAGVKSWCNLEVVQILAGGGRSTLEEKIFGQRDESDVSKELISIVKQRDLEAPGEGILLYVYKPSWRGDMASKLMHDMRRAGINLDEKLPNGKPRLSFETWGKHEGLNDYDYCTTVILVGILQNDHISLAAMVKAQKSDLAYSVDSGIVEKVDRGQNAHDALQALSRGTCRKVTDGIAHPMKAYIIHKGVNLQYDLAPVMPGVKWSLRDPEHLTKAARGKAEALAQKVAACLDSIPSAIEKVTSDAIKAAIDFPSSTAAMEKLFVRARKLVGKFTQGWVPEGRGFARV
jgi:hypothetical protein